MGKQEVIWFETLEPILLGVFEHHRSIEKLSLPFGSDLFVHIHITFVKNHINEMDLFISTNDGGRMVTQGCWLGVHGNTSEERKQPWGKYVHNTVVKKGIQMEGDYNFSLTCELYQGRKFTNFLFLLFFYILKLHATYFNHTDYVICADDAAVINGVSITEEVVRKLNIAQQQQKQKQSPLSISQIMNTPLLYYERFGFIYPEKYEFFSNYLNTGRAFIIEGNSESEITRYYLNLNTTSRESLLDVAERLTIRYD